MSTLLLLLGARVQAGEFGNPAREEGLLSLELAATHAVQFLAVQDCAADDCSQRMVAQGPTLRLGFRPHPALGITLNLADPLITNKEASFQGRSPELGAALALTWPRPGPRPALMASVNTSSAQQLDGDTLVSVRQQWGLDLAGVLALGSLDDEVTAWLGPVAEVAGDQRVSVAEDGTLWTLNPAWPVGALLGAELFSTPLGAPWAPRRARVSFGGELRLMDVWSGEAWVGVVW